MKTKEIEHLIDRYFDAMSTAEEERLLKQLLATTTASTPKIEEAKAVLGYFSAYRRNAVKISSHRSQRIRTWIAAAGVAVIFGMIGATLMIKDVADGRDLYALDGAYINGLRVDDYSALACMQADLRDFREASEDINAQMQSDFDLFEDVIE